MTHSHLRVWRVLVVDSADPANLIEEARIDENRRVGGIRDLYPAGRVRGQLTEDLRENPFLRTVLKSSGSSIASKTTLPSFAAEPRLASNFKAEISKVRWKPCPCRSTDVSILASAMITFTFVAG
ncbi:hypothetical protein GS584_18210 [Rhodococcus hoagii]|nr:hypothetical protein [Prescottella equi]